MSDDEILELFLFDQSRAMKELLTKHSAALNGNLTAYAVAKRYGNAFVEDAVVEAMLTLTDPDVRNEIKFLDGKILAYLTDWGKSELDKEGRKGRQRRPLELDFLADPRTMLDAAEEQVPPPPQLVHLVRSALDRLRPGDRGILLLRYERGLSEEEIAARLKITAGVAKKRLHDARKRFRGIIEDVPADEEHKEGAEEEAQVESEGGDELGQDETA